MLKILNVVGARPNFMKMAPLVREMARRGTICQRLVHTGQHYDPALSDVFFEELGLPRPDVSLGVGSLPRPEQIRTISERFDPVVQSEDPDLVLVVGDVNSTIACASTAKRYGVKVAHVEAGLRSFDPSMPEEHNRTETDAISDFLFITEESAATNLVREGVPGKRLLVGNVMIDTLIQHIERARALDQAGRLGLEKRGYVVSTFHRPSNVDSREGLETLLDTARLITDLAEMVLPLHPRTLQSLVRFELLDEFRAVKRLRLIEPLGYLSFISLVDTALAVVTDSGGIQDETTYLRVPCLTMRPNTERPVTVAVGSNVLVGSDLHRLAHELRNIVAGTFKAGAVPPLWDGRASERIVQALIEELDGRRTA